MNFDLKTLVESRRFELTIMVIIMINAVTLGLETDARVMEAIGPVLIMLDRIILGIFVVEVLLKMWVYRLRYFHDPWRIFDFTIVDRSKISSKQISSFM